MYYAVNEDGLEVEATRNLKRTRFKNKSNYWKLSNGGGFRLIPEGSIEKLIGKKLTWMDEPVCPKNTQDEPIRMGKLYKNSIHTDLFDLL
jgi:hypothetical protein